MSDAPATKEQALFARVFRGQDGDAALAYLRAQTLERVASPEVTSSEGLWMLEGRRSLAKQIINLVEQGRKG